MTINYATLNVWQKLPIFRLHDDHDNTLEIIIIIMGFLYIIITSVFHRISNEQSKYFSFTLCRYLQSIETIFLAILI